MGSLIESPAVRALLSEDFQSSPAARASVSFLPSPSRARPRVDASSFLLDVAVALYAAGRASSKDDYFHAKVISDALGDVEDLGLVVGAVSLLTTYVTTEVVSLDRQRDLLRWFRAFAQVGLDRQESITVRVDDRCAAVWERVAVALQDYAATRVDDREQWAARAATCAAEVVALREHFGLDDDGDDR